MCIMLRFDFFQLWISNKILNEPDATLLRLWDFLANVSSARQD